MSESISTNATHASLLAKVAENNQLAWSQLVELYGPLVANWCRGCRLDSAAVADIVQEVFFAVSRSLSSFRSSPGDGAFRGWLWKITRNKMADMLRKHLGSAHGDGGTIAMRMLHNLPDPESLPDAEPSDHQSIAELTNRALEQIRGEFQPTTWTAFWRSAVDGVPSDMVASELGMTPAGVRQARSRILRRLRIHLSESFE